MVNKINGEQNPKYNKITLKDPTTNQKKTYLIPLGKKVTIGREEYEMDKVKNGEVIITGNDKKDSYFKLAGLALEHLDVNKDGKIDEKDSDYQIDVKMNEKALKGSKFYVQSNDYFSDAGVYHGEGGVVFSEEGKGQIFQVEIEENKKE